MGKRIVWSLAACLLAAGSSKAAEPASAEEMQKLRATVEQQAATIQALISRIEALEGTTQPAPVAEVKELSERVAAIEATTPEWAKDKPEWFKWVEKVKLSGDFRYRYEWIDRDDRTTRSRNRIRARIGLDATLSDEADLGFRLASGSSDPVSTNQTLTDAFSSKDVWIDLAYFDWHPTAVDGLHVIGGKMKNPFYTPGKTELIWDGDLNPEGLAVTYSRAFGDITAFGSTGGFFLSERSRDSDACLVGIQGGAKYAFADGKAYVMAGAGYFDVVGVKGKRPLFDTTNSFGNTITAADTYANDYDMLESFAEAGFEVANIPVAVFVDAVTNTGTDSGRNSGWLTGFTVGKAKKPGSWAFRYNYRVLEADAVLGVFTDSDLAGGGTNVKGHELGFDYQLSKYAQAGLTYFVCNEVGISSGDQYERVQADLQFKF